MNSPSSFAGRSDLNFFGAARDVATSFQKLVDPSARARAADSFNDTVLNFSHGR